VIRGNGKWKNRAAATVFYDELGSDQTFGKDPMERVLWIMALLLVLNSGVQNGYGQNGGSGECRISRLPHFAGEETGRKGFEGTWPEL
jgi:hypothetical protein